MQSEDQLDISFVKLQSKINKTWIISLFYNF